MKILKNKFVDFVEKASMNGLVNEVKLNFSELGLKFTAMEPANVCMVSALLKKEAFVNYDAVGEKSINDLKSFVAILKTFNNEIELQFTEFSLLLKEEKKQVLVPLMDNSLIEQKNLPDLQFDDSFEINFDNLKNLMNNISTLNKEYAFVFETSEKKLKLSNEGTYKFSEEYQNEQIKGGVKVKMGEIFKTASEKLNGLCSLHLKSDYPLKITYKNDDCVVTIIVAPRIEEEE